MLKIEQVLEDLFLLFFWKIIEKDYSCKVVMKDMGEGYFLVCDVFGLF